MRVLVVSPTGGRAGVDQALLTLVRCLAARPGWAVHVAGNRRMALAGELEAAGASLHHVDTAWWFPPGQSHAQNAHLVPEVWPRVQRLLGIVAEQAIDVVVSNSLVALDGAIAAGIAGVPHCVVIHALLLASTHPELSDQQRDEIHALVGTGADVVVCPSRTVAADFERATGAEAGRVTVVPNAVDVDRFRPRSAATPTRPFTVTVLGHVNPTKDQLRAVALAARLRDAGTSARLLLVGPPDPAYAQQVRARIDAEGLGGSVELVPAVTDVRPVLAETDVLLSTSVTETFPVSMLEAMACGLPIVATATAGARELVQQEESGFVGDDDADLVDALQRLARDAGLADTWGRRARAAAERSYSMEAYGDALAAALEPLTTGADPSTGRTRDSAFWSALLAWLATFALPEVRVAHLAADLEQTATVLLADLPFAELARYGVTVERFGAGDGRVPVRGIDLAWVLRDFGVDATRLLTAANESGLPTVYETDDNLDAVAHTTTGAEHLDDDQGNPAFRAVFTGADVRLVHSPLLARDLARIAEPVTFQAPAVFVWSDADRASVERRRRIGTIGSLNRHRDYESVVPALRALLEGDPELEVDFFGFAPDELADHPRVTTFPFTTDYRAFLAQWYERRWAVALAPLADTRFNAGKTDNKFREFAAAGVPGVYSDVEPYRSAVSDGVTGLLVRDDPAAWQAAISALLEDGDEARALARRAQDQAKRRYSPERYVAESLLMVRHLASDRGPGRAPATWDHRGRGRLARSLAPARFEVTDPWLTLHLGRAAEAGRLTGIALDVWDLDPTATIGMELLAGQDRIVAIGSLCLEDSTSQRIAASGPTRVQVPLWRRAETSPLDDLWLRLFVTDQRRPIHVRGYWSPRCGRMCRHLRAGYSRALDAPAHDRDAATRPVS